MKNSRDSAFSFRGLEAGLWAFRLQMFAKCDALPKGDLFSMMDMFAKGIHSRHSFLEFQASTPPESRSTLHQL